LREWAVLKNRGFTTLLLSRAFAALGSAMFPVVLSFIALNNLHSVNDIGVLLAAEAVPYVVLLMAGGLAGDRRHPKLVLLASDVARAASWVAVALLLATDAVSTGRVALCAAAAGGASAFGGPVMSALVPATVPECSLGAANAFRSLSGSTTSLLGPAAAGLALALSDTGVVSAVVAGLYLVSGALVGTLHVGRSQVITPDQEGTFQSLREGWKYFRSASWLWASVAEFSGWHLVVYAPFIVIGAVVAKSNYGGAASWGAVLSALGLGTIIGSAVSTFMSPRRPLAVALLAGAGFAAPLGAMGAHLPLTVVSIGAALAGAGSAIANTLWDTSVQSRTPRELLSRVSAFDLVGTSALLPLGYALAGPVASAVGPDRTLLASAALAVVGPCVALTCRGVREAIPPSADLSDEGSPRRLA